MATTYEKIATTTLGSATASINFTSIGSGYTDLRVVLVCVDTTTFPQVRFNSDSGSNYSWTYLSGNGTAAQSGRFTNQTEFYNNISGSSTVPFMTTYDIFSYAGSTYKTMLFNEVNDKNGSGVISPKVGLWRSTSAITAVNLKADIYGTTFGAGTTATLYGILKA